jgi:uncharacterized Tic20 family protein
MNYIINRQLYMEKNLKEEQGKFAIPYRNFLLVILGVVLMLIGYALMIGGGSDNPTIFTGDEMFSFRRIVISPLLILLGLVVEVVAIMHVSRSK